MRKLFLISAVVAIGISACGANLKEQIKGKWLEDTSDQKGIECIHEYLEKVKTSTCKQNGAELYAITSTYEVDGDNIVFTSSKETKNVVGLKISGDEMQTQNIARDRWVRFTRIK